MGVRFKLCERKGEFIRREGYSMGSRILTKPISHSLLQLCTSFSLPLSLNQCLLLTKRCPHFQGLAKINNQYLSVTTRLGPSAHLAVAWNARSPGVNLNALAMNVGQQGQAMENSQGSSGCGDQRTTEMTTKRGLIDPNQTHTGGRMVPCGAQAIE